jgi:uncharacterized protein (TIGR02391 family)
MIENPVEWLASVSKQCRLITETAALGWLEAEQSGATGQLTETKPVLVEHFRSLRDLIPEDFPNSRLSDLARHIKFCELHDCKDIVLNDVPDVLAKAEEYATELPTNRVGELSDYLAPQFRQRFEMTLAQPEPDYHALVLTCCIALGDMFKRKAGVAEDSDSELGRAFKANDPLLLVTGSLNSEQDRNYQRGAMLLFQGARAFLRNTHAHEQVPTDKELAVHALMLLSLLADILGASKVVAEEQPETGA